MTQSKIGSAIVVIGKISSGKSTLARFLSERYSIPIASFGNYVKKYCEKKDLPTDRTSLQNTGELLIETDYVNFLKGVIQDTSDTSQGLIFDGVRHKTILDEIYQMVQKCVVIFVTADDSTRFERYKARSRESDTAKRYDLFVAASSHAVETEVELLGVQSDWIIDSTKEYPKEMLSTLDKDFVQSKQGGVGHKS